MFSPTTVQTFRGIHKSCDGPYPGYDQQGTYTEPPPNGRVRPEAEENALKHQGSLNLFGPKPYTIKTPRPISRCPSEISRSNMEYSRKGTVCNIISGQASHRPDTPAHLRVRPEASEIAENHKGKSMANILQNPPKTPGRDWSQEENNNSNGSRPLTLLHHSAENPASYRPAARVKPEAQTNAQGAKGNQMAAILGVISEDELKFHNPPAPKNNGGASFSTFSEAPVKGGRNSSQMKRLLNTNSVQPLSPALAPRVKSEGEQMSRLDQGGRMNKLIHNPGAFPSPGRPMNRNGGSKTAKQIAVRNRGTVGNILANIGSKQIVGAPGL